MYIRFAYILFNQSFSLFPILWQFILNNINFVVETVMHQKGNICSYIKKVEKSFHVEYMKMTKDAHPYMQEHTVVSSNEFKFLDKISFMTIFKTVFIE